MKYVPCKKKGYNHQKNKGGNKRYESDYHSNYSMSSCLLTGLVPQKTFKKLEKITTPIEGMAEFQELDQKIRQNFSDEVLKLPSDPDTLIKALASGKPVENIPFLVPEGYREKLADIQQQYKDRIDTTGGTFLMQFNVKTGVFGGTWMRSIQAIPNEITGEMDHVEWTRISWFRYFFYEVPAHFFTTCYCKLNNLYYRKEIEEEYTKAKDIADKWWAKVNKVKD